MRKLLFVALGIMSVGCIPAPTRMVVIGDSHSVPADAWPSAIDCMDVANRSISGAGLGTSVWFPALVDRPVRCRPQRSRGGGARLQRFRVSHRGADEGRQGNGRRGYC